MCGDTHMTVQLLPLFSPLFHLTAFLPLSAHQSTHRPRQQLLNHQSKALSCSPHLYLPPLASWPVSGPQQAGLHSTSHTYQLCQPANGRLGRTAGNQNKRRPFWPMDIHLERSDCRQHFKKGYIKMEEMMPDWLPGHEASRTGHTTAYPNILPAALSPATAASSISPRTSGQSVMHPAAHHRSEPTGGLINTKQSSSTPQSSPHENAQQQTQDKITAIKLQTLQRQTVQLETLIKNYMCGTVLVNSIQPYSTTINAWDFWF